MKFAEVLFELFDIGRRCLALTEGLTKMGTGQRSETGKVLLNLFGKRETSLTTFSMKARVGQLVYGGLVEGVHFGRAALPMSGKPAFKFQTVGQE